MHDKSVQITITRDSRSRVSTMSIPLEHIHVFDVNPYESHPALSATEAELLWEYAKLAQHVKDVGLCAGSTLDNNVHLS